MYVCIAVVRLFYVSFGTNICTVNAVNKYQSKRDTLSRKDGILEAPVLDIWQGYSFLVLF
jgi:hypothetical protein